ncbi:MAG: HU family DNA-binding protein [Methyloprofundus sp.]|nr:HU family DNA-binding protein [Methyloprofundus sp.]
MSKEALVEQIMHNNPDMTKKDAGQIVQVFTQGVTDLLKQSQDVSLIGFGKFSVNDVPARTGRNPSTGETIQISARKQAKFAPGKALKDAVN